jgi:hypothetical protein
MKIHEMDYGRSCLDLLGDRDAIDESGRVKGFNQHNSLFGFFLSFFDLSFEDDGHYFNKKSVVHYMKRNLDRISLSLEEKNRIRELSDDSTAKDVEALFKKVKATTKTLSPEDMEAEKEQEKENNALLLSLINEKDMGLPNWYEQHQKAYKKIAEMTDSAMKEKCMDQLIGNLSAKLYQKTSLSQVESVVIGISGADLNDKRRKQLAEAFTHAKMHDHAKRLARQIKDNKMKAELESYIDKDETAYWA